MLTKTEISYSIVGYHEPADGLGQIHICFYEALDQLGKAYFNSTSLKYAPPKNYNRGKINEFYDVVFFADQLDNKFHKPIKYLPVNANLKIAYSMFETDKIPSGWVTILNQKFDAVIVPDIFLKTVYENSGVVVPIFVISAPIYKIADLDNGKQAKKTNKFIFLYSSTFSDRKNQITLLKAFKEKFANNPEYELILHGRKSDKSIEKIKIELQNSNLQNVKIINNKLDRNEYVELLQNASCYVSPSKGEGFAIPPREALAIGLPVILTDCAAQSSLCKNSFYVSVKAELEEDCYYQDFACCVGKCKNCNISDLAEAMERVAKNYDYYCCLAQANRNWAFNFSVENFRNNLEYFLFYEDFAVNNINLMSKIKAEKWQMFCNKLQRVRLKKFLA